MNFSSEYEIDAEHEVDSTPTNDEESAVLAIFANNPLTNEEWIAHCKKELKANWELEQQLKQRLALEGREEAGMMSFARECLHFISHVRSSRLVLVFLLSASRIWDLYSSWGNLL